MRDENKTKKQLIAELAETRQRLTESEILVSGSRRTEAELRRGQVMLDRAQEIARLGYWEFDLNRGSAWASPGARQIYGLGEHEWTIENVQKIPLPEYRNALDEEMKELVEHGKKYDIEFKIRRPTDNAVIDIHSMAKYNPDTRTIFGVIQDISASKHAEEALRESETLHRFLTDNATDMISRNKTDRTILYMTPSCESMLGYRPDEMVGRPASDFVVPEDMEGLLKTFRAAQDRGEDWFRAEFRMVRKDGSFMWAEGVTRFIRKEQGDIVEVHSSVRDITERKQAEEALIKSEEKFSKVFRSSPAAISITRLNDGLLMDANEALLELLKYSREELIGHTTAELHIWADSEDRIQLVKRLAEERSVKDQETRFRAKDGEVIITRYSAEVVEIGGEHCILSLLVDIGERKKMEEALSESEKRFRTLFENAIEGIFQTTLEGRALMANSSLARILGYRSAQEAVEKLTDIGSQVYADPEERKDLMSRLIREGKVTGEEVLFKRPDGTKLKVILNFHLVHDKNGNPVFIEGSCIDITAKWLAEEALREREELLRTTFNATADGVLVVNKEGKISQWNRQFARMWRIPQDLLDTKDDEKVRIFVLDQLEQPDVFQSKVRDLYQGIREDLDEVRFKDGRVFERYSCPMILEGKEIGRVWDFRDITIRKQAEETLKEYHRQIETLLGNLPGMAYHCRNDQDWTMDFVSEGCLGLTGYNPDDLIHNSRITYNEIIHPDDRERIWKEVQEAVEQQKHFQLTYRIVTAQGELKWVWEQGVGIYDSARELVSLEGFIMDITERKNAEEALRESERYLADIIEFLPDATLVIDRQGKVVAWNKAMENMTGVLASDIIGRGDYEYAIPFYGERRAILIDIVLLPKEEIEEKYYYLKRAGDLLIGETDVPVVRGRKRFLSGWAHPIFDSTGNIAGAIECIRDITDQHMAEEALEESEVRYRLLAENASDIIFTMDTNLRFTYISPSVERIRGFSVEEAMNQEMSEVLTPTSLDSAMTIFREEMEKEASGRAELWRERTLELEEICRDGSTIWTETTLTALRDKEKSLIGFVGITRNITDRKRESEEKKRLEIQLIQAQKMESIGTLAGGIAHDFNNILSAIIGYSQLAMEDITTQPEKSRNEIREVLKAGDRAKDLVSQILTFSRKAEITYTPISLRSVVKEALKMLRSVIPTTIEIRQDIIDSGMVLSDLTQINQIIMNLCANASHAMDEGGGVLSVTLKRVSLDSIAAPGLDLTPGSYMKLSISDTGHGMTPEVMERIFEPYFTTKEFGRGTGLGLSVVHGIVKSHKGAVTCRSVLGEGTTFDVFLPETGPDRMDLGTAERQPYPAGTESILFIDDEPTLTSLTEKILTRLGYTVVIKNNSNEALALFREKPDRFDLVITDMTMPSMTGDKLAQKIMEIRQEIPVILCTGYSEHMSEEKAKSIGIRKLVMKPLEIEKMALTIRKVLDGEE